MDKLLQMIINQHHQLLVALGQHLALSFMALLIAVLIAIPLAMIFKDHRRLGEIALQVAGVFQTIPSLALLGLLIPLVGIGNPPALIALVAYAIMPIYQNTYTGLTTIDPNLEEAAIAMGLSRWMRLRRLELPMALPLIFSGIRIALVMTIGTATLAALIGAGGLGTYIVLGIEQNNNQELLIGAVFSAILALVFSVLLKVMGKSKRNLKIGFGLILLACIGWGGQKTYQHFFAQPQAEIVIAGKMGSEPEILINMYKELIQAKDPSIKIVLKPNFGGTTFLYQALKRNQIDIYPEFTGTVLKAFAKAKTTPQNPQAAYRKAATYLKTQQLTYLKPMAYQNGYDLAVTPEVANQYSLKTISDLASVSDQLTAAFDPDFSHQKDGYLGLKSAYHLQIGSVRSLEPSLRYQAIAQKRVQIVDGYTTDPEIRQFHLVVLKDDQHFFPPYQGAPLMKTSFAKQHPTVVKQLNKLSGRITMAEMQTMNYRVTVKHEKAKTVARQYLLKHHLISAKQK